MPNLQLSTSLPALSETTTSNGLKTLRRHISSSDLPAAIGAIQKGSEAYKLAAQALALCNILVGVEVQDAGCMKDFIAYRRTITEKTAQTESSPLQNLSAPSTITQTKHALTSLINLTGSTLGITGAGGYMSTFGVAETVDMIVSDYGHLTLSEVVLAMKYGTEGRYGKAYNAYNKALIVDWLDRFDSDVAERVREERVRQIKLERSQLPETPVSFETQAQQDGYAEFQQTLADLKERNKIARHAHTEREWGKQAPQPTDGMGCPIEADATYYVPNLVHPNGDEVSYIARYYELPFEGQDEGGQNYTVPAGWYWELPGGDLSPMHNQNQVVPVE